MSERLSITPLGPYIGAQISGADLTRPLSDNQFEQLYHAVLRHHVVFLRDQAITPQQQRALAQRFGELHIHPVYPHAEGVDEIIVLDTHNDNPPDNDNWHTDVTFIETPPAGAILAAKELPVAEIEHLFPQSKFPQLILCISNYIPCCSNCNKIKKSSFFSCKKEFIEDLQKLGKSFHHPLFFWKLFDANFDYNLPAVKKCDIVQYYKINERFNQIRHYMYSNLFNLVKYHNIETPEALESFLESCQNANMQEMVSDFSLNNHPKLWHDFIDYVLYDYNNLTALWEEIKEYNKLKYYC